MKISTYNLVTIGIILASLAYYFQNRNPLLSSVIALTGAALLIIAAKRIGKNKKQLKALRKKNSNSR